MLNYKLKDNCINADTVTPIKDYLFSLGITKIDSFLSAPPIEDELSPFLLDNMEKCVERLHYNFINNKRFLLIVDCDVDGFTSSAIFYRFFKNYYEDAKITYFLHEGKEHGIEKDKIPALDTFDVIIVPDAGSMQLEEQTWLIDNGKEIIIIDHHNVTEHLDYDNLTLVNNQCSPNFENKSLSGAGVVLKVIQAYASQYPDMYVKYRDFYDLAALGILADCMDMRTLDNNYIVYQGLHNIRNEMFKALLRKQQYSIKNIVNPSKIDVVFYISPLINSVIRAGSQEEKEILFKGFIHEPDQENVITTYRGQDRNESFYDYAARLASNARSRQNAQKEKCFNFLRNKIQDSGLDKNKVIAVITSADDAVPTPQNITGLIAMELLKYYNKPVLVLRPRYDKGQLTYAGSGRSKQLEDLPSFLQFVRDSDASLYGEGHACAFGASIIASEYENFIKECNERLKDVDFNSNVIEVDVIFDRQQPINKQMLYEFGKYDYVFGNSIPQPKIAIEATVSKENIMIMGKDASSIKINIDGISCVKFKDTELVAKLMSDKLFNVSLVGRPQINNWMGNESIQIMVEDIEVKPKSVKSLF